MVRGVVEVAFRRRPTRILSECSNNSTWMDACYWHIQRRSNFYFACSIIISISVIEAN